MEITNLSKTSLASIVDCLSESFKNYFVKMPSDVDFWKNRFNAARVDYSLSFGVFDNHKLVAFILHGIDTHNHQKTAFNTGTGVLESYRGQKLVDKMYAHAIPKLKEEGIEKCMLEVIDENHRAIKVYERIGFSKERFLYCFNGSPKGIEHASILEKADILNYPNYTNDLQHFYSWDNSLDAIRKSPDMFDAYLVKTENGKVIGYFVLNNLTKALIQIEAFEDEHWGVIFDAIQTRVSSVKINNVDSSRTELIKLFTDSGLDKYINQFEMTMPLN